MGYDYWTVRYSARRVAAEPVTLAAPLTKAWKHRPGGPALGWVRAGKGRVLASVGRGAVIYCLDLQSGKNLWTDPTGRTGSLVTWWKGDLIIDGMDSLRALDIETGHIRWERQGDFGFGVDDSFLVGDVLVGMVAEEFHAIDLNTLQPLWRVEEFAQNPLVGDETAVIRADEEVTCYELLTGAVRWRRPKADFGGGKPYLPGCIWEGRFIAVVGDALTALDVSSGATVWRSKVKGVLHWWHPYDGKAYLFFDGDYVIVDLKTGERLFERSIGPTVPVPVKGKRKGLTVSRRGVAAEAWRAARIVVSETHAFVVNGGSGQIVVLGRESGEVEQVTEIDAMPIARYEPVIYENHLLLTDLNAAVHCFKGAP